MGCVLGSAVALQGATSTYFVFPLLSSRDVILILIYNPLGKDNMNFCLFFFFFELLLVSVNRVKCRREAKVEEQRTQ